MAEPIGEPLGAEFVTRPIRDLGGRGCPERVDQPAKLFNLHRDRAHRLIVDASERDGRHLREQGLGLRNQMGDLVHADTLAGATDIVFSLIRLSFPCG